jgi:hypothetical protein
MAYARSLLISLLRSRPGVHNRDHAADCVLSRWPLTAPFSEYEQISLRDLRAKYMHEGMPARS